MQAVEHRRTRTQTTALSDYRGERIALSYDNRWHGVSLCLFEAPVCVRIGTVLVGAIDKCYDTTLAG